MVFDVSCFLCLVSRFWVGGFCSVFVERFNTMRDIIERPCQVQVHQVLSYVWHTPISLETRPGVIARILSFELALVVWFVCFLF